MWLTEAVKEQTGVRIQFNAVICGTKLQIYETLKIISRNIVCINKIWYFTHIRLTIMEEILYIIECIQKLR